MLVYGGAFQWAKYGHHILPSNMLDSIKLFGTPSLSSSAQI
jgi:hypothetical protein